MHEQAAEDALHAAIAEHARVSFGDTDDMLSTWAVVSVWIPPDYGEQRATRYAVHFPGGNMPEHEVIGLAAILRRAGDEEGDM